MLHLQDVSVVHEWQRCVGFIPVFVLFDLPVPALVMLGRPHNLPTQPSVFCGRRFLSWVPKFFKAVACFIVCGCVGGGKPLIQLFSFGVKFTLENIGLFGTGFKAFCFREQDNFSWGKKSFLPPPAPSENHSVRVQGFVTPPDFRVTRTAGAALSSTFRFEPRKINGEKQTSMFHPPRGSLRGFQSPPGSD